MDSKIISFLNDFKFIQDLIVVKKTLDNESLDILKELSETVEEILNFNDDIVDSSDLKIGDEVTIKFSDFHLNKFGIYYDQESFLKKNRINTLNPEYYLLKEKVLSSENNDFNNSYKAIIKLIQNLKELSKFDSEKNLIIFQDKKAISILLDYNIRDLKKISNNLEPINKFSEELIEKKNTEKYLLLINELVEFLGEIKEEKRFSYLLRNFKEFYDKTEASYGFYLSNFSFNKLKMELDNSVLDFSKNIRSVINDSQTKLIAIPAASLLIYTNIDWDDSWVLKSLFLVISSFLFSFLIEVFIKNQESSLSIISDNMKNYKSMFRLKNQTSDIKNLDTLVQKSFSKVDREIKSQKCNLEIIRWINWVIPISLLFIILIQNIDKINC